MTNGTLSLKTLLALDAAACTIMGAALLLGSTQIAALTGIPAALLFWAGATLIPAAAFMAASARAVRVPAWAAMVVVIGNVVWAAASLLLPLFGLISPSAAGWAFLAGQAGAVAVLARLEFDAARGRLAAA